MTQEKALQILKAKQNVFLTGVPGSGKTYTVNKFTEYLRDRGVKYSVTASTGIAATHINGTTIHSWSGLGIKEKVGMSDIDAMMLKSYLVKQIASTEVLIIDEISMLSAQQLDCVDFILRNIRQNDSPFGGIQMIFVGDFYQLPPVDKKIGNSPKKFAFEAESWKNALTQTCYLTEQHRSNDGTLNMILNHMRAGTITQEHKDILLKTEGKTKPVTKLFTHNADVDQINELELGKIKEKSEVYYMTSDGHDVPVAMLKKSCLSPEVLTLKKGAIVMFTRNNFEAGYVNGTLGKVVEFDKYSNYPVVELKDESRITLDKAEWVMEKNVRREASVTQIPLRLAWAFSVHKSQGMSLDSAFIDLSGAFEYGQGYVALSRVVSLDGMWLEGANDKSWLMHPDVVEQDKVFRAESEILDTRY